MILVDSSKYISWLRLGRHPVALLGGLAQSGELLSCGIVRIEVLRGVLKAPLKQQLTEFFDALPEVALSAAVLEEAADLAWRLDRQGQVLPVSDLLIAVCARRADAVLVTEDRHFQQVPGLRVQAELQA